ncbi:MAG TPA: hypothetical protein VJN65_08590 [Bacteroidota bacterium]|nr:hypothetical protein [Bacteroidota bacterium]
MKPLPVLDGATIKFIQKSIWKRHYEFAAGDTIIGTFSFPHVFSDQINIEHGEHRWVINTKGVFNPVAMVRMEDAKKPIATVSLKQTRGTYALKLPRYRTVRLTTNMWKSEYVLKTSMNATLFTLKLQQFPRFSGEFTVEKQAELLREYPWLVYLVAYIALLAQRKHG